ncbi:SAV_2336 N-terminal domain-related protein [Streptomyces antioxidans]|uniref:SAV_2336 N-terminal domain-related protein n=1 Tax=Streptomyces antioxidans TaxID=1507734 RepID=UPI000A7A505B|nr:SAV_2336 N-terminal domain-related protein [Streptomyces antioxidans]
MDRGDTGPGDTERSDAGQGRAGRLGRLDEAVGVLASSGLELSKEELLDALWLAGRLPEDGVERAPLARAVMRGGTALPATRPGPVPRPVTSASDSDSVPDSPTPLGQRTDRPTAPDRTAQANGGDPGERRPDGPPEQGPARTPRGGGQRLRGLYGGGQAPAVEGRPEGAAPDARRALPLRVPEDKALHQELSIGRALRPLKQHRPNPLKREFDEAATATALAETGLPDVVTRPARERWLDLALVIDDGMSMLLWRRLAVELRTVLQRSGAFRVVRVLGLHTRGGGAPALRARPYAPEAPLLPTTALSDPSGHTLVLVVSDGVGTAWRNGRMGRVLARWAGLGPTAVVHALPPRLWEGSGIRTRRWQVRTRRPGSANADWTVADPVLPAALARFAGVPVPVLEPDAGPLADWARLIASASGTTVLPLLVPPRDGQHDRPADSPRAAPATPAPADELGRVQRFRDAASPEAYRLAAHLAAVAPLPVPVMRMVQKAVDGRTDTGRLAEVFLGGVMRPVEPPASAGADPLPPEHRPFTFTDAAQRALLGAVPLAELVATSRLIGRRLEQLAGRSPDFPAWLADPGGSHRLPPGARPFSTVERRLAARLGAPPRPSAFATPTPTPTPTTTPTPTAEATTATLQWRPLASRDPRVLGPYRLRRAGPRGARVVPYLGQDAYGEEAVVTVAPELPTPRAAALLGVQAEALRRMDGRHAPRLLREGLDEDVPWVAEEVFLGHRLHDVLFERADQWDGHTALAIARRIADAVRVCAAEGMAHGDLTVNTVHIAGEDVFVTGWSSARIDGVPSPTTLGSGPPTPEENVGGLGVILLCLGGGGQQYAYGRDAHDMPRWSGDAWRPVRDMVRACLERQGRPTAAQVCAFLTDFRPDAGAREAHPRRPRSERPTTCALCGNPLDPHDRFCDACGADLTTAPPLSAPPDPAGAPRTEPASDLPSFGQYRAHRRLGGSRGYGVYLARATHDPRGQVVIRTAEGAKRELRTEAEALRRMSGHYAPRLFADASSLDPPWITQEFIHLPDGSPAPPLSALLGRRSDGSPPLDAVHAATIGLRIAEAVNMCSLKGVGLGTLTADTVLVVGRTVKLIRWTDASIDARRGTPTAADNVYALGEILRALSDAQPTAQLSQTGAVWRDPQLISTISACLDERPEGRPSAGRVADVLVQCLPPVLTLAHTPYEVETSAPPPAADGAPDAGPAPTTAPEQPQPPRSTRSRLAALVGLGGRSARAEQRRRKLDLIRTPLPSCHRIAVISLPYNARRTATTLALGAVLASERQDKVIAVDAMPGGDSLTRRVGADSPGPRVGDGWSGGTIADLARADLSGDDADAIRRFTSWLPSGLEVLLGDPTPRSLVGRAAPIDDMEYRRVMALLARHYPLVLSDSDTSGLHRAMRGIPDLADQLIVVTTPSVEHMRSAHQALDRLAEDGHPDLVRGAITVVNMSHDVPWTDHYESLTAGFRDRCRGVAVVPYDEHLAYRGEIDLRLLASRTLDAYLDLAALVAEGFPGAGT